MLDVLDLTLYSTKYRELIFTPLKFYKHIYYVSTLDMARVEWSKM